MKQPEGTPISAAEACLFRQKWLTKPRFPEGWFENIIHCPEGWTVVATGHAPPVPRGDTCYYRTDPPYDFPPGGKVKTSMRKCPTCRRWRPPNGSDLPPPHDRDCCDCETTISGANFEKKLKQDSVCRGLEYELRRLYWPSAMRYGFAIKSGDTSSLSGPCLVAEQEKSIEYRWRDTSMECREGNHLDDSRLKLIPDDPDEQPPAKAQASRIERQREQEKALARLNIGKKGKGWAAGCQLLLLPEDDDNLEEEINETRKRPTRYWGDIDQLRPSVRRLSRSYSKIELEDPDFWSVFLGGKALHQVHKFEAFREERFGLQDNFLKEPHANEKKKLYQKIINLLDLCTYLTWPYPVLANMAAAAIDETA